MLCTWHHLPQIMPYCLLPMTTWNHCCHPFITLLQSMMHFPSHQSMTCRIYPICSILACWLAPKFLHKYHHPYKYHHHQAMTPCCYPALLMIGFLRLKHCPLHFPYHKAGKCHLHLSLAIWAVAFHRPLPFTLHRCFEAYQPRLASSLWAAPYHLLAITLLRNYLCPMTTLHCLPTTLHHLPVATLHHHLQATHLDCLPMVNLNRHPTPTLPHHQTHLCHLDFGSPLQRSCQICHPPLGHYHPPLIQLPATILDLRRLVTRTTTLIMAHPSLLLSYSPTRQMCSRCLLMPTMAHLPLL